MQVIYSFTCPFCGKKLPMKRGKPGTYFRDEHGMYRLFKPAKPLYDKLDIIEINEEKVESKP